MPRTANKESTATDATANANTSNRKRVIRQSFERMYAIDCELDDLVAEHLKALREEKSEIKKRLREEFQMPAPLVQARYQAYRVEQDAAENQDDVTLAAIREMWEVLPVGGQVSFLPAIETSGGEDGSDKKATVVQAYDAGKLAGKNGSALDTCPFATKDKKLKAAWEQGWDAARNGEGASGSA